MTYPVVSLPVGLAAYQELASANTVGMPSARSDERGQKLDSDSAVVEGLDQLRQASELAARELSKSKNQNKLAQIQIEANFALNHLYPILKDFPAQPLRDPDFWRHLTFKVIDDWVIASESTNKSYLGLVLSAMQDCWPLIMFNRSELSLKHSAVINCAPSELYCLGNDFWRSHILRVQTKFEDAVLTDVFRAALDERLPTKVVRPFAKDIQARRASVFLGGLDANAARKVVEDSLAVAEADSES